MAEQTADSSLARRLFWLVSLPVALLLTVGVVLGLQINRMSENAHWVDHTDTTISKLYEIQKRIIDQETGLRGYMVTESHLFLEPYESANVDVSLNELGSLLSDNPEQLRNLRELQARYDFWFQDSEKVRLGEIPMQTVRNVDYMKMRKQRMDQIRGIVSTMLATERHLREARQAALNASNQSTGIIFVVLLSATAIVISLFSRRSASARSAPR